MLPPALLAFNCTTNLQPPANPKHKTANKTQTASSCCELFFRFAATSNKKQLFFC